MAKDISKRVVVTGIGIVAAIGRTLADFSGGLFSGTCGIREISLFDTTGYKCKLGGQVSDEAFRLQLTPGETKRTSRCDLLGLIAAKEAISNSRIHLNSYHRDRIGVIMGGGAGGMLSWEKFRRTLFKERFRPMPSLVLASAPCTLTDLIANHYGFNGIRSTIATACSSSANAIGYAYDLIRSNALDRVITGGSEAFSELTFAGFNSLKVMSSEPCQPFDSNRTGLSLGEGSGIMLLEDLELAEKRNATVYAEVIGYALNSDAFHMTSPDPEGKGMIRVMVNALKRSGIDADQVDYINAHGTATKMNDQVEAMAIRKVFGDRSLNEITVSSTKSMIGHCLGASGALEAIATILALCDQKAPPTIHLDNPDPNCMLNHVANVSKKQRIRVALSNSFAFGGNNTSLVFKRVA
jgi:3-oxoacyl-[acyl-carrier-protein] synthase II